MNNYQATGTLKHVWDAKNVGRDREFYIREFVILTYGQYGQLLKFQLSNDHCDIIDRFALGQDITVHFDIKGRKYEDRVFNTLTAWKVDFHQATPLGMPQHTPMFNGPVSYSNHTTQSNDSLNSGTQEDNEDDDLPF